MLTSPPISTGLKSFVNCILIRWLDRLRNFRPSISDPSSNTFSGRNGFFNIHFFIFIQFFSFLDMPDYEKKEMTLPRCGILFELLILDYSKHIPFMRLLYCPEVIKRLIHYCFGNDLAQDPTRHKVICIVIRCDLILVNQLRCIIFYTELNFRFTRKALHSLADCRQCVIFLCPRIIFA